MKFKAKHKVLHLGGGNPKHKHRLGNRGLRGTLRREGLGRVLVDEEKDYDPTMSAYTPENQVYPGLHPEQCGQQVREVLLPLCSGETPPASSSGATNRERCGPVRMGPEDGHKNDQRPGASFLGDWLGVLGLYNLEDFIAAF
ncbi:hypothetical protein DUI87_22836 [Hirundo rustica rustica]|uniref:Uncharacterized protein n=1 Tax=Hirundo rustica rustica TaxID=333673 RepID=A0A3M0JIS7_HIRRU|nr:hypothetical protein DUI87_22836 [Hirundo rustica rustica]